MAAECAWQLNQAGPMGLLGRLDRPRRDHQDTAQSSTALRITVPTPHCSPEPIPLSLR
jgi:hypothetical protein